MSKRRLVLSEESSDCEMEAVTLNQASPEPASEEVEWTWKREGPQISKSSVKLFSRRSIIKEIAKELKLIGDGVYQEFINSCFGFLMRFNTQGCCCVTSLHCLFAHEVIKADASPDELWYRVGGHFIRFSRYEYALVTGLSFGPTTFDPSSKHVPPAGGLFLRHYRGKRLKMDTLRRDFTDGVFRESSADALKVANLLIVYFLLFGLDGRRTYIDEWAWALIEDTNQWETFNWGTYTYEILLRHLQRVTTKEQAIPSYRVYGFVWAFWIWAFEAIPKLGNACGVPTDDDVLPRCLRWEFRKMSQLDIDGFYDREMEVQSTLEPSGEEQRQPYWEHIHDNRDNPFNKKTSVSPSSSVVPPVCRCQGSKVIPTPRSCSNSATPIIKKLKRADPPTTCAPRRVASPEKAILKELSTIVRKELTLVQQELPSLIRQEVHLALKELFSESDSPDARYPTVGVQCDETMVGKPVVPRGFEKYKCVDTMVVKMSREIQDLRDEKLAAIKTIDELRLKQLEADKAVELYKSRLENLLPKSVKIESDMLTVEVGGDVHKLATSKERRNLDTVKYNEHREPQTSGNNMMEINDLNDEVSTNDSDDSSTDSRMDALITSLRSKTLGRKWTYEADRLRAFQQDEYRKKKTCDPPDLDVPPGFDPL
ncbi:hypothetical protein CASFOL_010896 [Castilleja foliolosa]|uniref:DUF1985 domain-containing protein n=1 Tax=Castilleja foliolosa TaxID=1961234 RepID=A0ABD3DY27_9LAMI